MPLNDDEKAELVAYLDGELDEHATQMVEAKLATDPEARAEMDSLKQTWGLLDYLPKATPSPNFTHRTMERLTLEKVGVVAKTGKQVPLVEGKRTRWWVAAGWVVGLLLAVGAGYGAALHFFPPVAPDPGHESDESLVRHLRVVEKWRYYENVDDRDFLNGLAQPDLFGEEPG